MNMILILSNYFSAVNLLLRKKAWGSSIQVSVSIKAGSHDLILRIRFFVPKIGSRRSDGPISRFHFCGENVRRLFVLCSHDPIFRTGKNLKFCTKRITGIACKICLRYLSRRVWDENRACSISIRFFKLTDPCVRMLFSMCSHDPIFEPSKIGSLKTDRVIRVSEYHFQCVHTIRFWNHQKSDP